MTEAEYVAYLNEGLAEEAPPGRNHYEAALVLLGIAQPGDLAEGTVVAQQVEFVGGFYRSTTKDIVLIEHDEKLDPARASALLVHEFIHALQDRDVDLEAFRTEHATSMDAFTAVRSLVEGEAQLHHSRYAAAVFGLDPTTIDWKKRFEETIDSEKDAWAGSTSVYGPAYQMFAYTWGARYAYHLFQGGGLDAVLARFASPPLTTRAFMASVDQPVADELPGPAITAPIAPPEWTPATNTTLGALGVYLVAAHLPGSPGTVNDTALGWRGDRLFVFGSTDLARVDTALVWQVDFALEADASAFAGRWGSVPTRVARTGARVTVARSYSGVLLPWAFTP